MAVYDDKFIWTPEADALDDELRVTLKPIIDHAIENGLRVEDINYVVSNYLFDVLISTVLWKRSEIEKKENTHETTN